MAGPIAIDTPDYQRGIIHPQILLATVAAHTATVAVPLPPNTETLLVQCWGGLLDPRVTVVGTTTHYEYPGQKTASSAYAFTSPTYLFDVSPALDNQVTVTFNTAPTSQWSVYADSGAHTVVDIGAYRDANGVQFMIPTAPSGGNWNHPPVELEVASLLDAPNGTGLIAAPGAGQRIRVFDAFVNSTSASTFVALRTSVTAKQIVGVSTTTANTAGRVSGYPSGIPMPTGEGVNLVASAGNVDGTVTYTVEII